MLGMVLQPQALTYIAVATLPIAVILGSILVRTQISPKVHRTLAFVVANQVIIQWIVCFKFETQLAFLNRLSFPFLLLAPLLRILFFEAVLHPKLAWQWPRWTRFLPFIFGLAYYIAALSMAKTEFAQSSATLVIDEYFRVTLVMFVSASAFLVCRRLLAEATQRLLDEDSEIGEVHLQWMNLILCASFALLVISAVDIAMGLRVPPFLFHSTILTLTLFGMLWMALRTSAIYEEPKESMSNLQALAPDELEKLKSSLILELKNNRLFLDPDLRLSTLANAMRVPSYRVTQVIKQGFAKNFNDLVNELRVEEAKKLLEENGRAKVLAVALESGFKSKSTFNDAFRRHTGMTPSQFKRSEILPSSPA
jgi:AraC-like DNA-binding protein